ncbi:MAG: hypothetical protein IKY27_02780 [Bacteroidales bacterium]|nr:hypothetical protein [Bacteroidales bacterium]
MRIIVVIILLAFGFWPSAVNGQQISCTVPEPVEGTTSGQQTSCTVPEPVEGTTSGQHISCAMPEPVEGTASGASTSSATSFPRTVDGCPLSVDYYEKQIHIADSLYKNYLPQYNFDEVKAAMKFFDSLRLSKTTDFFNRIFPNRKQKDLCTVPEPVEGTTSGASTSSASSFPRTVDRCPLSVDFNCAKAHYYHAVGLTERDDIVGACEHYLIALEIMEEDDLIKSLKDTKTQRRKVLRKQRNDEKALCDSATLRLCDYNKEDYEKIRFVALIYTRLGRLFLNENYCDLAIIKYRKTLEYVEIIDEKPFKANVLKELGNSYHLSSEPDSALYYYNKSLRYNSALPNKLDVEKSIAQILFDKGEKDTAYLLIKNNLNIIDNENVRYSYYATLGRMCYEDNMYDSAIYYLEKSIESSIYHTKATSAMQLSAIFDSLGNYEKKSYYDTFVSKISVVNFNKGVESTQLHTLYIDYSNRKAERERLKLRSNNITANLFIFMLMIFIFLKFQNKHKKISSILNDKKLLITQIVDEIKLKEKHIGDLEFKQKLADGKIRQKNNEIKERDELLIKYRCELSELKNKLERLKSECSDINKFLQSEVCSSILNHIDNLSKKNIDSSELEKLTQEQFILLSRSANIYLNNVIDDISNKYPKLKNDDLYYICLVILNLSDKQISSLFGVTYNTIKVRKRKICSILGINNDDLHGFLINIV